MTETFRKLVDQHRNRVYTFAFYSLGNREEAEDATQEVLLRLWKNLKDLDPNLVDAWVTRVSRNVCIDLFRRRRAYTARFVANAEGEEIVPAVSTEPSPEDVLESSELRVRITRALAGVREPYKSVVILREIQDMRYEEICDTLDLPLNTVKSYLHRARRMLREQLDGALNDDTR